MSYFNREQDNKIKNDIEVLIRRLMRDELNQDEMIELKMKLQQGSLQSLMPEYFTHLKPDQRIVETARMIKAFDKYGYQVGSDELNPAFESELSKPLNYSNGIQKSLTESFGDLLPQHSNSDFVTMKRPNELPRVFFRGSKMNYQDPNMIKDWIHNISTIPLEGTGLQNNYGNNLVEKIKGDFNKIIQEYGGIEKVAGFSKGGALAAHLAQKLNLEADIFNPHINNLFDFKSKSGEINIHRIINDPATAIGSLQGGNNTNFNVKTYPPVVGWTGLTQEHELHHFTDDYTPRELFNRFALESDASNRMRTTEANMRNLSSAAKANINKRIKLLDEKTLRSYIAPRNRSLMSGIKSHLGNVRGLANMGVGLGIGTALNEIASALDIDEKLNPELYALLLGALSGGLTEASVMKLSQGSVLGKGLISRLANLSRVGSSVLAGGIGLVISDVATRGIFNAFSPDANPYLKHIFSNVVGGEIGTIAGIGLVAGLGSAASYLGVVSAANWWNPVGWASAIALAITGGVGIGVGVMNANTEIRQKELINYAGQSVLLRNQHVYMREILNELGMPPQILTDINSRLLNQLGDAKVQAMTSEEFSEQFNTYMQTYATSYDRTNGPPINTRVRLLYQKYNNSLRDLADNLNRASVILNGRVYEPLEKPIVAPTPFLMTDEQYVNAYNKMLEQLPHEILDYWGFRKLDPPNSMAVEHPNALPDTFSETEQNEVLDYETTIEDQIRQDELQAKKDEREKLEEGELDEDFI